MAIALADPGASVDLPPPAVGSKHRFVGAKSHRPAEIVGRIASFKGITAHPLGHQPDDRMLTLPEFRRHRTWQSRQIACRFDHRHVHAEADAEIGYATLAGKAGGFDHALGAALAKSARNENAMNVVEVPDPFSLRLEDLGIDPVDIDRDIVGDPTMAHGLG